VRNPLAHALGVFTKNMPAKKGKRQRVVIAPKDRLVITKGPLSEDLLRQLEGSMKSPFPTIEVAAGGGHILYVIGLYWGVRVMLTRLTHDVKRMADADKFLDLFVRQAP
jgi:hypothetical protein